MSWNSYLKEITISLVMICQHIKILHNYKDIIIILHIVHFICVTHLFHKWKFVPLNFPHLFISSLTLPSGNHLFILYNTVSVLFCLFIWFIFSDSPYKWNHVVFVFFWLILFSIILPRSIQVGAHAKISFLCVWLSSILYWIYTTPSWASLVAQLVKNLPAVQEIPVWFLGWEHLLEKGYTTHFGILGLPWWLSW